MLAIPKPYKVKPFNSVNGRPVVLMAKCLFELQEKASKLFKFDTSLIVTRDGSVVTCDDGLAYYQSVNEDLYVLEDQDGSPSETAHKYISPPASPIASNGDNSDNVSIDVLFLFNFKIFS